MTTIKPIQGLAPVPLISFKPNSMQCHWSQCFKDYWQYLISILIWKEIFLFCSSSQMEWTANFLKDYVIVCCFQKTPAIFCVYQKIQWWLSVWISLNSYKSSVLMDLGLIWWVGGVVVVVVRSCSSSSSSGGGVVVVVVGE